MALRASRLPQSHAVVERKNKMDQWKGLGLTALAVALGALVIRLAG